MLKPQKKRQASILDRLYKAECMADMAEEAEKIFTDIVVKYQISLEDAKNLYIAAQLFMPQERKEE